MRILLVSSHFKEFQDRTGIGTVCSSLVQVLINLGHKVVVCHPGIMIPQQINQAANEFAKISRSIQLKTFYSDGYPYISPNEFENKSNAIMNYLKNNDFDLVLFNDFGGEAYHTIKANRLGLLKTKVYLLFHGPLKWHMSWHKRLYKSLDCRIKLQQELFCIKNADKVLFPTAWSYNWAVENKLFSKKSTRFSIQPFPVYIKPKKPKSQKLSKDNKHKRPIVFWGRTEKRKGIQIFLNALLILKKSSQLENPVVLLGSKDASINEMIAEEFLRAWQKENQIKLIYQYKNSGEECTKWLLINHALVVLPAVEETMGCTVLEALQTGLQFIYSDIQPHLELTQNTHGTAFKSGQPGKLANAILTSLQAKRVSKLEKIDWCKLWAPYFKFGNQKRNSKKSISNLSHRNKIPKERIVNLTKSASLTMTRQKTFLLTIKIPRKFAGYEKNLKIHYTAVNEFQAHCLPNDVTFNLPAEAGCFNLNTSLARTQIEFKMRKQSIFRRTPGVPQLMSITGVLLGIKVKAHAVPR